MSISAQLPNDVLRAISEDYESVEIILRYLRRFSPDAKAATSDTVGEALAELIKNGLAQAYLLSAQPPHAQKVDFDLSRIGELWFYVTPEGKKVVETTDQQSQ